VKLGLQSMRPTTVFGQWSSGVEGNVKAVRFAERLGYDSVWTAEAAGTDAFVPLAWLAAHTSTIKIGTGIIPISARTPATTAMTAATLDRLSNGRLILGLGTSGPAVVEGWHGASFKAPLARTEEYVRIVREILARRNPQRASGDHYPLPYPGSLERHPTTARLMFRPRRQQVPIYLAAMGAKNLHLATRISDGVIPAFYSPYHEKAFFEGTGQLAFPAGFELAPFVTVSLGDNLESALLRLKPSFAFWLGGMGSGAVNYYAMFAERIGFADFPEKVRQLYRAGYRADAAAAIPDDFVDSVALCGPRSRVRERAEAWRQSSVTTMIMTGLDKEAMIAMAEFQL
jgi:F420-dependent oxidoreductase-like protein